MSVSVMQTNSYANSPQTNNRDSAPYKPFQSEKDLIMGIYDQEIEISNSIKLFAEVIPKNLKLYKEYGDRLMYNGERMRLQLNIPG